MRRDRGIGWPLFLWNGAMVLLSPLLLIDKYRRFRKRSNFDEINPDRWNIPAQTPELMDELHQRPGPHVVFVGASFGELLLIERLTDALHQRHPEMKITWTIRDRNTRAFVKKSRPRQSLAVWPFDFIVPVRRFIRSVRPDVMVLTERFRFTNFVSGSARAGSLIVLMNGRCKRRDSPVYWLALPFYKWVFSAFDAMLMQTEEHAEAARPLVRPDASVVTTGDVKFDLAHKPLSEESEHALCNWLHQAGLPILVAGSTDSAAEEEFVIDAYVAARAKVDCRLMLAPRRPERRDEIIAALTARGLTASLRSRLDGPADVYLLDTLGELFHSYRYATAAYVGGSFDGMGHNVVEPVQSGLPVAYGMRRGHFQALQELCERFEVGTRVARSDQLADFFVRTLTDEAFRSRIALQAEKMMSSQGQAFERTLSELERVIEKAAGMP